MGSGRGRRSPSLELKADDRHCLESAARREYHRLSQAFLRGELEEAEAEERIDLLREFLENADFATLRRSCEERLREGREIAFLIYREGEELRYGFADEAEEVDPERGRQVG